MDKHPISVNNKVVLITGANGLIGKEISFMLLKNNAKVILADINNSFVQKIKIELSDICQEDSYMLQQLDITDLTSISRCLKTAIEKFGHIDVLINNAAIDAKFDNSIISKFDTSSFENYPLKLLRESIEVNIIGTIQITQHVCKQMIKQGFGSIINVASTYSLVSPNQSLYDYGDGSEVKFKPIDYIATKSFIPNFTRFLATFYAQKGIRCNAIVPHGIYNDHDLKFQQNFAKLSPMARMCDKSELNGAFMLLCSEASSYMTGSMIVVDGGWTAW